MKHKLTFFIAAGFLFSIASCDSSDEPGGGDASIVHDAQPGSGGATGSGGKPGTGGVLGGSGGASGLDGAIPATGGMIGTGGQIDSGVAGAGGHIGGAGGSPLDSGYGEVSQGPIDGPSGLVCGGIAALQCPKGQFCEYLDGTCSGIADATGICTTPSEICVAIYQPVCGCDGKSYGNDCERRGAGVSKLHDGVCSTAGKLCGGIAALQCPKGQFCEYLDGTCSGIADATGTCATPSEVCGAIYQPVCGCDGKSYGNDCERRGAGVSKLHDGVCSTAGKMCGGIAGIACAKGQFCDLVAGDCGTIADGAGTCAATGEGIACDKVYRPVCGCDGRTYGNDCERQVAGVSKASDGACAIVDGGTTG